MLELMSNVAPLGFERFSPLVNPLEVAVMPPFGSIRAETGIAPTTALAGIRLDSKGTGAPHSKPRHPARVATARQAPRELHSVPTGMALFSPAVAGILLEAQAGRETS